MRSIAFGLCALVTLAACGSSGDSGTSAGADGGAPIDAAADGPSSQKDSAASGIDAHSEGDHDAGAGETRDSSVDASPADGSSADASVDAVADSADDAAQSIGTDGADLGSIIVSFGTDAGGIELCPNLDGLGISPAEVIVGGTIELDAYAEAPNASALVIAWTATSGHFTLATGASTVFTCTSPGVVTITATATDGPGLGGAPVCSAAFTGTVLCAATP